MALITSDCECLIFHAANMDCHPTKMARITSGCGPGASDDKDFLLELCPPEPYQDW